MDKLIADCKSILGVRKPLRVIVRETRNDNCALYWNEGKRHTIELFLDTIRGDDRNFETILAHEIVHAWQTENKPRSKDHGRIFQNKAWELECALKTLGYNVSKLYIKGIDK